MELHLRSLTVHFACECDYDVTMTPSIYSTKKTLDCALASESNIAVDLCRFAPQTLVFNDIFLSIGLELCSFFRNSCFYCSIIFTNALSFLSFVLFACFFT